MRVVVNLVVAASEGLESSEKTSVKNLIVALEEEADWEEKVEEMGLAKEEWKEFKGKVGL